MKNFRLAILPVLAVTGGLGACAPVPAQPYYTVPPPSVVAVPPSYRNDYVPSPYGQPAPAQALAVDPYCREAFANAVDAQQRASVTQNYADAARAERSAGFLRRDCH